MKIQCDVCNKDEASVFCVADEAALCDVCDHSIHYANKLSSNHHRFSLLKPSPNQFPTCDICQEKKAILFCQQDRAILCQDCDIPIHKANKHTENHDRFLLTGVKLSPNSAIYSAFHLVPDINKSQTDTKKPFITVPQVNDLPCIPTKAMHLTSTAGEKFGKKSSCGTTVHPQIIDNGGGCNGSTSSISEYLMGNLPGWHVEDLLEFSNSAHINGLVKTGENDVLPFWDDDIEGNSNSFYSESVGFWVPEAPIEMPPYHAYPVLNMDFGGQVCFEELKESGTATSMKASRKWGDDGGFTVPEATPPPSMFSKRSRTLLL